MRLFQSLRRPLGGFMMDPQAHEDVQREQERHQQQAETARVNFLIGKLIRRMEMMMHTLDDVLAEVTAERTAIDSLATLTAGIKKQLDEALGGELTPSQQMRVDAIFNKVDENKAAIMDAINASDNIPDNITDTTVTSSNARAVVGDPITFSAAVAKHPDAPADLSPTGAVSFTVDGTPIGSGTLDATGVAVSVVTTPLPVGDHQVIAIYGGDKNFASSASSPITQTIVSAATA